MKQGFRLENAKQKRTWELVKVEDEPIGRGIQASRKEDKMPECPQIVGCISHLPIVCLFRIPSSLVHVR